MLPTESGRQPKFLMNAGKVQNMTRITNIAFVFVIALFAVAQTLAQAPSSEKAATQSLPNPQLEFVGQERYDVNGAQGTRYKLSVTNRTSHPDFLWHPSANLPPCGKNENASRTWVEIFGSPGDKRLAGFCRLRSSEDLAQLWFAKPAGEKGPPCVYIVMTDRETGQKYESNRVCSRLFPLVTGTIKGSSQAEKIKREKIEEWIELNSTQINESAMNVKGGSGSDTISNASSGATGRRTDSGVANEKLNGTSGNTGVSRDQMAALIMRGMGEPNPPQPTNQRFVDVPPSSPFYAFIDRVAALGIIQGCSRGKFCPAEPVAREHMAAFIIRVIGISNPPTPAKQRFVDVPPSSPFYGFIDLVASRKLIAGCGGNNFCPKERVTLDEAAAALRKAFPSNSHSTDPKIGGQQQSPAEEQIPNERSQVRMPQPDLTIRQFLFPPTNDKALRVRVVNTGQGPSAACRLVLTVRKINGVAVGRTTHVNVPVLAAGAADWLHIDVKSILPNNVSLQSTTFRLNVDATKIVAESNEANNEVWHNQ